MADAGWRRKGAFVEPGRQQQQCVCVKKLSDRTRNCAIWKCSEVEGEVGLSGNIFYLFLERID